MHIFDFASSAEDRRRLGKVQTSLTFRSAFTIFAMDMEQHEKYTVRIECRAEEGWRYNLAALAGALDEAGNRIGYSAAESHVADVGSSLEAPPPNQPTAHDLKIETVPCERLTLYLYVVPHSLPRDNEIGIHHSFPLSVQILYGSEVALQQEFPVNPWGGASVEIKLHRTVAQHAASER